MLMNESPMETPTQAPTDTELDKETGMAIESLIKDIAEESFTIKTKIPSQNDIIQIETDEEDDYLEMHPEDPNYIPPPKTHRDLREETKSRE
uniref:Uncharacterized protein n=1 Tax=Romanomermis culicivorax TaxID=13658 RepID=A0A915HIH3_ROMCU